MRSIWLFVIIVTALLLVPIFFTDKSSGETEELHATIETNRGSIEVRLFEEDAPNTVDNFVRYAEDGFYQGTIFHRVIQEFMIQGGGFDQNLNLKEPTYNPIENEAEKSGHRNERGTIAMARTGDPHSATSQFFINTENNPSLDWDQAGDGYGYCVFGEVVDGMDTVDEIESVETDTEDGMEDVPQEDIVIEEVSISRETRDEQQGDPSENEDQDDPAGVTSALASNIIPLLISISLVAAFGIVFYLHRREKRDKEKDE